VSKLTESDIKPGRRIRLTGTIREIDSSGAVYVQFDGGSQWSVMEWEEVLEGSRTRKPVNPWDARRDALQDTAK